MIDKDNVNSNWQAVKKIKSSDARKVIPKECYKQSLRKTFFWYTIDLVIFFIGFYLIFSSNSALIKILGGFIAGTATSFLFVWAHDAAHGALFKSSKFSEWIGTISMLPSLNMYRMWSYGHNKVHHGFTSFTPIDLIWSPLTPQEYQQSSFMKRFIYRIDRNFFTCAFHYFRHIWLNSMIKFNPGKNKKQKRGYRAGKIIVLIYSLLVSIISYVYAGGFIGIICALIIPFIVFNYFIAMIVYLHHTHPDVPYFDVKNEWSHAVGALSCSITIHSSKLSRLLLHNIMVHIPHHLDTRVPFYNLPKAYRALKTEYGDYLHEYKFKWSYAFNIFKQCKLYDFETKTWHTFK